MKRPNILLIILDAVRAKNLSIYGYEKNTTPNLKKLLPNCVLYRNAISSSYWTMPSIASLFTGTYPSTHYLIHDGDVLRPNFITLPEFLKENGYLTIGLSPNPYVSRYSGLHRGFDIFDDFFSKSRGARALDWINEESLRKYFKKFLETTKNTELYKKMFWYFTGFSDKYAMNTNQKIFSLIQNIRSCNKPFFIYVHYNEAHTPYLLPRLYREHFLKLNLNKEPWKINQNDAKYYSNEIKMNNDDFQILKDIYDGAIKYLDQIVYDIFIYLKNNDLFENTLIIVTSDHGDQLGEHDLFLHHFSLYDELIKIPLIIKYPKNVQINRVETKIVQNVDIFPTILDLLQVDNKFLFKQFQGNSIISSSFNKRNQTYGISELLKPFGPIMMKYKHILKKYDRKLISIRTMNHKYIYSTNGMHEYYDLKNDPNEINNIINMHSNVKSELKNNLNPWIKKFSSEIFYKEQRDKLKIVIDKVRKKKHAPKTN